MTRPRLRFGAALVGLLGLSAGLTGCFGSPSPQPSGPGSVDGLPEAALEVMDQPPYANGQWLVSVTDLDSGEVVIDLNTDQMAEPASFVKSYSVGAGWLEWGPDRRITTPVKRTGEIIGGELAGDLVLVGKGDITLGGRTSADGTVAYTNLDHNDANPIPGATLTTEDPLAGLDDLAAQVKASGINVVGGNVIVDDRLFQDELEGEPITPIVVNQNLIDVVISPGAVGEPAEVRLVPEVAPWRIVGEVRTVADGDDTAIADPVSIRHGEIEISGTITADASPQLKVLVLEDPATFARTAFIESLARAGVAVDSDPIAPNSTATLADLAAVDDLPSVAELVSLPFEEDATYVMKVSYNRGAQTIVCLLSAAVGVDDCSAGLPEVGRIWSEAGLDATGIALVDGSGLGGNFVTPESGVALQQIMFDRPDADRWRATLPILGVDGSLADVQTDSPAAGHVFAKTGTLVDIDLVNDRLRLNTKALGGVMETAGGRTLGFVIIVNQGFVDGIDGVLEANDDVGAVAASIQQAY